MTKTRDMVPPGSVFWADFFQATDPASNPDNEVGPGMTWFEADDDAAPAVISAIWKRSLDNTTWIAAAVGAGGFAPLPPFVGVLVTGTGQQGITSGSEDAVTWGTDVHDTDSIHDTGSNTEELVTPVAGYWEIFGALNYAFHATGARWAYPWKNGAAFPGSSGEGVPAVTLASGTTTVGFSVHVHLDAGDIITCISYQTSGGALNVNRAGSHFGMTLIRAD